MTVLADWWLILMLRDAYEKPWTIVGMPGTEGRTW